MRSRPRYSLLTLLVLTALVDGGVKLWYGPNHVIERPKPEEEVEYTFTRDWRGERTTNGPYVERLYRWNSQLLTVKVCFYRQGVKLQKYVECRQHVGTTDSPLRWIKLAFEQIDLSPDEEQAWIAQLKQEEERFKAQGLPFYSLWMDQEKTSNFDLRPLPF